MSSKASELLFREVTVLVAVQELMQLLHALIADISSSRHVRDLDIEDTSLNLLLREVIRTLTAARILSRWRVDVINGGKRCYVGNSALEADQEVCMGRGVKAAEWLACWMAVCLVEVGSQEATHHIVLAIAVADHEFLAVVTVDFAVDESVFADLAVESDDWVWGDDVEIGDILRLLGVANHFRSVDLGVLTHDVDDCSNS